MALSKIPWCHFTYNTHIGCSFAKRADGTLIEECLNCYAKELDDRRYSKTLDGGTKAKPVTHWGKGAKRHKTKTADQVRRLNALAGLGLFKECDKCGWYGSSEKTACYQEVGPKKKPCGRYLSSIRPRVFCLSLGDWLDEEIPIEWTAELVNLIADTPYLDWLLLTKRPQRFQARIDGAFRCANGKGNNLAYQWAHGKPPANVWIGVSAGADLRAALDIPARIHFLSCEPMLRPLMVTPSAIKFDWIIFGGESGSMKAKNERKRPRPLNLLDLEAGVRFCKAYGIACFVKQMGSNVTFSHDYYPVSGVQCTYGWAPHVTFPDGHRVKLRDTKHGEDMTEWPEFLRVREFPTVP